MNLILKSDEDLMVAYNEGSKQAFHILYSRYSSKTYGYLKSKNLSEGQLEDTYYDIFVEIHKNRSEYSKDQNLSVWIFNIISSKLGEDLQPFSLSEFQSSDKTPPNKLTVAVLDRIEKSLEPSLKQVLPRFLGVTLAFAFASLAVFSQFGLGPVWSGLDLGTYLMSEGIGTHAVISGAVFVGLSSVLATFFLTPLEVKTIYRASVWLIPVMTLVGLFLLIVIAYWYEGDAEFFIPTFVTLWSLGALVSSRILFRFLYRLRVKP